MPKGKQHSNPHKKSNDDHRKMSFSPSPSPSLKFQVQKGTQEASKLVSQNMGRQRLKTVPSSNKGGTISFGINKVS